MLAVEKITPQVLESLDRLLNSIPGFARSFCHSIIETLKKENSKEVTTSSDERYGVHKRKALVVANSVEENSVEENKDNAELVLAKQKITTALVENGALRLKLCEKDQEIAVLKKKIEEMQAAFRWVTNICFEQGGNNFSALFMGNGQPPSALSAPASSLFSLPNGQQFPSPPVPPPPLNHSKQTVEIVTGVDSNNQREGQDHIDLTL